MAFPLHWSPDPPPPQITPNAHPGVLQALVKEHGKAYEEMRSYFNDITANTLDLIKALKADAVELILENAVNGVPA